VEVLAAYLEEGNESDTARLVISLGRSVEPRIFALANPSRLIVDIPNAYANEMLPGQISPRSPLIIKNIRIGEHIDKRFVRFVCDLFDEKKYDVVPRLYLPQGENSQAKLIVIVTTRKSKAE
jgi:hypothetical protein